MHTFNINLQDSLQIWRSMYLVDQLNILKVYCERLGWALPSTLKDTYKDAKNVLMESGKKLKDKVLEEHKLDRYFNVQLDTGLVTVSDEICPIGKNPISWSTARIYQYPEQIALLFPDQVKDKMKCLTFYLTDCCNLRCAYCYEHNNSRGSMSTLAADAFLHKVFNGEYEFDGPFESCMIQFIGGEPLLHPEMIHYIIDKYIILCLEKQRYDLLLFTAFTTTTNGTQYSNPAVKHLLKNYPNLQVAVSLDGIKKAHDTYRKNADGKGSWRFAVQATRFEANRNPNALPKMTFGKETLQHLYKSLIYFRDTLGVSGVTCTPALEEEYTVEDAIEYYKQLRKYADYLFKTGAPDFAGQLITGAAPEGIEQTCGGQGLSLAVFPNGEVYTCQRFSHYNCQCENAEDLSLDPCDSKGVIKKLSTCATKYPGQCGCCPIKGRCRHCAAIGYAATGRLSEYKSTNGCLLYWVQAIVGGYYTEKMTEHNWFMYTMEDTNIDELPCDVVKLLEEVKNIDK